LRDQIVDWLGTRPMWERDLARRLADRPQLTDEAFDEALRAVLGAFGALGEGVAMPESRPLRRDDLPTPAAEGAPRLLSIGTFEGVGAISNRTTLRFEPDGLTIV